MLLSRSVVSIFSIATIVLGVDSVFSQTYPNKTIRILAGGVGGGTDIAARLIAQGISGPLGQPVIVENRPPLLLAEIVAKAPPDGYLMIINGSNVWIRPLLQNTPYDPVRDLAPITMATTTPNILVVHPLLPVKSVKDLIALAKARPGQLNYASATTGGSSHLHSELFKFLAGVNIVRVVYSTSGAQTTAVIIGEAQMSFDGASSVAPHLKSGKMKALAIASAEPSARYPGLPTIAASLPGFESVTTLGIFVPAKTPASIITRLNQEIVRVLNQADVKEKLLNAGLEAVGSTPEAAAAIIKANMAMIGKVIKDTGIKVE